MHVLHCLQRLASDFHDLINFLNLLKELLYLTLFGTSSQIFGRRYLTEQFLCFLSKLSAR